MRSIELLAPASNAETAIEAILHGADAVYLGGPSHGARKKASNSLDDIKRVIDFAHRYNARVYVTVNTIVYEPELKEVERLIDSLYRIGTDAIIIQDMGILRMEIPPIALHASTQCDTRTPQKAKFMEECGVSQIVLARELTLAEIKKIADATDIVLEAFVHGALCVSYSGRCHASARCTGRSANRGECAQICRLPYTLTDSKGTTIVKDRHLLSLKDLNLQSQLEDLMEAGVRSFKIEGRLKDIAYVKNITALYRREIDKIIAKNPDKYRRSSHGESVVTFTPDANKSFNRGFTDYFLNKRRNTGVWQPSTPKSLGEKIHDINTLNNGDGISWIDNSGTYKGVMVNGIKDGKIIGHKPFKIPRGTDIFRTFDNEWTKKLSHTTARRLIGISVSLDETGVTVTDQRGIEIRLAHYFKFEKARNPMDFRKAFDKFGNTIYRLNDFRSNLSTDMFVPISKIGILRKKIVEALDNAAKACYKFDYRKKENPDFPYPDKILTFADNVSNSLSERFYRDHGVAELERAFEISAMGRLAPTGTKPDMRVMTTRHCILRELGMCRKERNAIRPDRLPLKIKSGNIQFRLDFDCERCEMIVLSDD